MGDIKIPQELLRKLMFVPCASKEDLHTWIDVYLGLDLPDQIVHHESNSSPMDFVWEIYSKALNNDDEGFQRIMAYASRASYKTLAAAVLEVLALVHMNRSVGHLAAIESQSQKAKKYVQDFLQKSLLKDFLVGDSKRNIVLTRYYDTQTGDNYTEKEYKKISNNIKDRCQKITHDMEILICTIRGANSAHVPFMCVEGGTVILAKSDLKGSPNRKRKRLTARGLFCQIAGISTGGNPKRTKEYDLDVPVPNKTIEVLSLNFNTGHLEYKPVLRGHRKKSRCIEVECENKKRITITPDHPIYVVNKGFVRGENLQVGDEVFYINKTKTESKYKHLNKKRFQKEDGLNIEYREPDGMDMWHQTVLGTLLGDTGIYKKPTNNPYILCQHGQQQKGYCLHKQQIVSQKIRTRTNKTATSGYTGKSLVGFSSGNSPLLNRYINVRSHLDMLEDVESPALAYWYMDDGASGATFRLSTEGWDKAHNKKISDFLNRKFYFNTRVSSYSRNNKTYYYISGTTLDKIKLAKICKQYIHPDLAYKFDITEKEKQCIVCKKHIYTTTCHTSDLCNSPICASLYNKNFRYSKIINIKDVGMKTVFDFTVADNNNFFGNQILNKNCIDELDIADPVAVNEASMIPSSAEGKRPITVLISTRKTAFGLVQKELDEANRSGLHVRHWNVIDATEPCPIDRRKNDELDTELYIDDKTLDFIDKEKFNQLDDKKKEGYRKKNGYQGCAKCPLFSICEGQLGYKQRENPNTLRPISDIISIFKKLSTEASQAQLMCRMPESSGLVFTRFDKENHMISASQMATIINGEEDPHAVTDKASLIDFLIRKGTSFYAGIDWGYNHDFSVISGAMFGQSMFIFDVISMPGLDPEDKVTFSQPIKKWNPIIFPDPEAPDNISLFRKRGFVIRTWGKGRGSVREGIDAIRAKLWDKETGRPNIYLLKDDPGCERLGEDLSKYHFKLDSAGSPTDTPDDKNDDRIDAFRYLILNAFKNTKITSIVDPVKNQDEIYFDRPTTQNYVKYFIDQAMGNTEVEDVTKEGPMRGSDLTGISWDME